MSDPFGQPPQDPYAPQAPEPPTNPYATPPVSPPPPPVSGPPTTPYGQAPYSGAPNPYAQPAQAGYPVAGPQQNSMALVAMILAVCGVLTWITAPIGAILGHVALKQIRETGESGEGMAKAGIIVGWILTALPILACCAIIAIGAIGGSLNA